MSLPSRRFIVARSKQNQIRDFLRVRHQRYVTRIKFDGRRVHALGQKSLELGTDRAVCSRYLIPRRFSSPCSSSGLCVWQRVGAPPLNGIKSSRTGRIEVAGKILEERRLAQPKESIDPYHPCTRGRLWELRRQRTKVLARVWRASRHVHQRRHLGIIAGFADDGSRKGVAHQNRRPILQRQDSASGGNVICQ